MKVGEVGRGHLTVCRSCIPKRSLPSYQQTFHHMVDIRRKSLQFHISSHFQQHLEITSKPTTTAVFQNTAAELHNGNLLETVLWAFPDQLEPCKPRSLSPAWVNILFMEEIRRNTWDV